jgi:hypothetical protein
MIGTNRQKHSSFEEFIDFFIKSLIKLQAHDFVAHQQSTRNKILLKRWCSVVGNFAKIIYCARCSSGVPLEESASLSTFICVPFQKPELCYAVTSNCLIHDTAAIYTFQKSLISYLQETAGNVRKIFLL